jgi:hypothetical protein
MEKIKVSHQSICANWINASSINNPRTLVLGSFNPYENSTRLVDYYYGRSSNHFWKTIALITNKNENYFFENKTQLQRKIEIMNNRFCCLDVIDSISFSSINKQILEKYLTEEIFSNFKDQKIWGGYTDFEKKDRIFMEREYNQGILDFLRENNSIKTIIHTMGSNRINSIEVKPKEKKLKSNGFAGFFNEIKSICHQKKIEINYESWSPSDYAIKNGFTPKEKLKTWLESNLHLKS